MRRHPTKTPRAIPALGGGRSALSKVGSGAARRLRQAILCFVLISVGATHTNADTAQRTSSVNDAVQACIEPQSSVQSIANDLLSKGWRWGKDADILPTAKRDAVHAVLAEVGYQSKDQLIEAARLSLLRSYLEKITRSTIGALEKTVSDPTKPGWRAFLARDHETSLSIVDLGKRVTCRIYTTALPSLLEDLPKETNRPFSTVRSFVNRDATSGKIVYEIWAETVDIEEFTSVFETAYVREVLIMIDRN